METENWFKRFKNRRTEKKREKIRQQFGFLIEEYKLEQKSIVSELKRFHESVANTYALQIEQKMEGSTEAIEKLLETRIDEMLGLQEEDRASVIANKQEINDLLVEITKKIENLTESGLQNQEKINKRFIEVLSSNKEGLDEAIEKIDIVLCDKFSSVQTSIDQSQRKSDDAYQDVKKVLQNIFCQLEFLQKGTRDIVDETEVMIDEKAHEIMLSVDEIKTLMKVIAVNNLLEEI